MNKSTYTSIILGTLNLYFLPAKKKEGICSTLIIRHVSKDFGGYHQITDDFGEYRTMKMILSDFHNGMKYRG